VIVWDLRTGQQHTTLTGHTQPVTAVACTRLDDGTPIAVTSAVGEVIDWELRTGQQHTTLTGHTQRVTAVACTRLDDGTPIAVTGGYGDFAAVGEVIVWDLCTGQHITLTDHTQRVIAVACTRLDDGTPIAVTGGYDKLIAWDLRTGQQHTTLTGHTKPVYAVACTRLDDGTPIAVTGGGGRDYSAGELIAWDLRTGRMQQTFAAPYPVGALCCDSDRGVAIGTASEIVRLQYGPFIEMESPVRGTHLMRSQPGTPLRSTPG
jgi:WD40 repeat protein